jgi:hypothetical protein
MEKRKSKKPENLSSLKTKAWTEFSRMIRLEARDHDTGLVSCVTCGHKAEWNRGIQAGHFIDGRYNSVIFHEKGVHPQCYACNVIYNGRKEEYFLFMERTYGREEIDRQVKMKWESKQFTREELVELRKKFKERADRCIKEYGP